MIVYLQVLRRFIPLARLIGLRDGVFPGKVWCSIGKLGMYRQLGVGYDWSSS
jgi:hypothetical protein